MQSQVMRLHDPIQLLYLLQQSNNACACWLSLQAKMTERNFSQVRREVRLMSIIR